jgi:hypothetical protein
MMKLKSKSQKRVAFLEYVSEAVTHQDIFGTIKYQNQSEEKIKQFIYPHLVESLTELVVKERGIEKLDAKELVKKALKWEGNVNTTVHHILFMGTQNRPDMVLEMNGIKIAIEFKRGDKGSDLRAGIGQSMIYSTHYDFVLYLFIDTSDDKRIFNATGGVNEQEFVEMLWDQYNIKFTVI